MLHVFGIALAKIYQKFIKLIILILLKIFRTNLVPLLFFVLLHHRNNTDFCDLEWLVEEDKNKFKKKCITKSWQLFLNICKQNKYQSLLLLKRPHDYRVMWLYGQRSPSKWFTLLESLVVIGTLVVEMCLVCRVVLT